ncbi:hypothetical protein FRC02_009263 [Tulasnella sp. 418]|nr:hypothetical protein FRC02_009263 [Tulasnella sp. 418]
MSPSISRSSIYPTSLPPFLKVPSELLITILEYAWKRDAARASDMASFSLVCSKWRPIAQRILFTEIVLYSVSSAKHLLRTLHGNKSLGQSIRILDFWNVVSPGAGPDQVPVRHITELCPNLYQLSLNLWNDIERTTLLQLLDPHTYSNLKALKLVVVDAPNGNATLQDMFDFLAQFSVLSHLRFPGPFDVEISPPIFLPPSPPFQLYEFAWEVERSDHLLLPLMLDWLFGEDARRLRILLVNHSCNEFDPRDTLWASLLRNFGKGLRSLRLLLEDEDLLDSELVLADLCPNLQELALPSSILSASLRELIPVTKLEHLVFRVESMPDVGEEGLESEIISETMVEREVVDIVEWIISLPSIRFITVELQESPENPGLPFPHIWRMLDTRHIELRVIHEGDYKDLRVEDMIPAAHFPRDVTVSNVTKMITPSMSCASLL